ncbi:MAG: hypothetical protein RIG61_07855 [Deltaproteobacteria bacterium]
MSEELRKEITDFINGKLKDSGKPLPEELNDSTPLITSGLLESLYLLELAVLIEEQSGASLDLTAIDFVKEWDTIDGIVNFTNRFAK